MQVISRNDDPTTPEESGNDMEASAVLKRPAPSAPPSSPDARSDTLTISSGAPQHEAKRQCDGEPAAPAQEVYTTGAADSYRDPENTSISGVSSADFSESRSRSDRARRERSPERRAALMDVSTTMEPASDLLGLELVLPDMPNSIVEYQGQENRVVSDASSVVCTAGTDRDAMLQAFRGASSSSGAASSSQQHANDGTTNILNQQFVDARSVTNVVNVMQSQQDSAAAQELIRQNEHLRAEASHKGAVAELVCAGPAYSTAGPGGATFVARSVAVGTGGTVPAA